MVRIMHHQQIESILVAVFQCHLAMLCGDRHQHAGCSRRDVSVDGVDLPMDSTARSCPDSVTTGAHPDTDTNQPNSLVVEIPKQEDAGSVAFVKLTPVGSHSSPWRLPLVSSPEGTSIPRATR